MKRGGMSALASRIEVKYGGYDDGFDRTVSRNGPHAAVTWKVGKALCAS